MKKGVIMIIKEKGKKHIVGETGFQNLHKSLRFNGPPSRSNLNSHSKKRIE